MNNMLDTIQYENKEYPARYIGIKKNDIPNFQFWENEIFLISVQSLLDKILNTNGDNFVSDEAEYIDQMIFFYVPDNIIQLSEEEIISEMRKSLI